MMDIVKIIAFLALILSFSAQADKKIDISGHYRCTGNDFLNHTTFDEPTTVVKTGDTFFFTWVNQNLIFYGTAILQNKIVSCVFWTPTHMSLPGVVAYEILPNGDLKGKWTVKNAKITGEEYCKKLK